MADGAELTRSSNNRDYEAGSRPGHYILPCVAFPVHRACGRRVFVRKKTIQGCVLTLPSWLSNCSLGHKSEAWIETNTSYRGRNRASTKGTQWIKVG